MILSDKRIQTDPHCFPSVVGPCGSGKTQLVSSILANQYKVFGPAFDKFLYLYNHFQPNFEELQFKCVQSKIQIKFYQGLDWNAVEKCEAQSLWTLLVIDDLYQQACEDEYFLILVIAGRHRNIHLITLKHNLFQQSKHSETIELNVTRIVFFKSPRDLEQIAVLGREIGDRQLLLEAYKRATREAFGHLLIDFDPHTDLKLKYASNCSGNEPSIFYLTSNHTSEHLNNETTRALDV